MINYDIYDLLKENPSEAVFITFILSEFLLCNFLSLTFCFSFYFIIFHFLYLFSFLRVNTFDLPASCSQLNELSDGNIIISILAEISPEHFDEDALNKEAAGNRTLCTNNLNTILRLMDDFYKTVLKKSIDMSSVDVNAIAADSDPDSLLELLELVVGAAVMCERKGTFIQAIFGLDHLSQTILKGLVEHAIESMKDYPEASGGDLPSLEELDLGMF
jgi:hypothetical protein